MYSPHAAEQAPHPFCTSIPVDIVDTLPELEYRVAFLWAACAALGQLPTDDLDVLSSPAVWLGLHGYIGDLHDSLARCNALAKGEATPEA